MNLPYKQLSLFVIGTLTSVLILIFITENYLSSSGFEYRQQIFNCLIDDLKTRNVTDDFFPTSSPSTLPLEDDTSDDEKCREILKQFTVFEDVREDLCAPYNVTSNLCMEISNDKELELCDAEGKNNQSKSSGNVEESCVDVEKYFKVDEASQYETLKELYKQNKVNCQRLSNCYDCIKESLEQDGDYERKMLHAKAVNFTIIGFEVWNYFKISSRVHELVNEANQVLISTVNDCQMKQECVEVDDNWKM